jgi:hypothetical protein
LKVGVAVHPANPVRIELAISNEETTMRKGSRLERKAKGRQGGGEQCTTA